MKRLKVCAGLSFQHLFCLSGGDEQNSRRWSKQESQQAHPVDINLEPLSPHIHTHTHCVPVHKTNGEINLKNIFARTMLLFTAWIYKRVSIYYLLHVSKWFSIITLNHVFKDTLDSEEAEWASETVPNRKWPTAYYLNIIPNVSHLCCSSFMGREVTQVSCFFSYFCSHKVRNYDHFVCVHVSGLYVGGLNGSVKYTAQR